MSTTPGTAACEHKEPSGCELTSTLNCCMCADRRPLSEAYPTYVDGRGMRNTGTRYQGYCWRCRDYWRAQELFDRRRMLAQSEQTWSFPSTPEAASTCGLSAGLSAGYLRRRDRPHRSYRNPLRSYDDPPVADDITAAIAPPFPNRPARRDNNRADRDQPSTASTTIDPSGDAVAQSRRQPRNNPFGTREEAEDPCYQSPVANLFARAWGRYRDAEATRRVAEAEIQNRMAQLTLNDTNDQETPRTDEHDLVVGRPPPPYEAYASRNAMLAASRSTRTTGSYTEEVDERTSRDHPLAFLHHGHPDESLRRRPYTSARPLFSESDEERPNPINAQSGRPPPLSAQDRMVDMTCQICYEQRMDTLLLPCNHLTMCYWCASIMRDRAREERRDGRAAGYAIERMRGQGWKCPICRGSIEGTRRIRVS